MDGIRKTIVVDKIKIQKYKSYAYIKKEKVFYKKY